MVNAFQKGLAFQSSEERKAVELQALERREKGINALGDMFGEAALAPAEFSSVKGTVRADQRLDNEEDQTALKNKRTARSDEISEEEIAFQKQVRASRNLVSFLEFGLEKKQDPQALLDRAIPVLQNFQVSEAMIADISERFLKDPEGTVGELKAIVESADKQGRRRATGQPIAVRRSDGTTAFIQNFTDGTREFIDDVTPLDAGLRERGLDQKEPGFQGDVAEEKAKGKKVGERKGEIFAGDLPPGKRETAKGKRNLEQLQLKNTFLTNTIDTAIDQTDGFTAGFFSIGRFIPGTPQANLSATLDTIKATIGFEELQRLRDNSKTGGALGQVSELENKLLQAVWGSVTQSQSPTQLRKNLQILKTTILESRKRIAQAFEDDFGTVYGGEGTIIPTDDAELEELLNKFAPVDGGVQQ